MVKYNMVERYILLKKQILTISSSKQSFEETSSSIFDDVNLETETCWKHPHGLRALFKISKDQTLDLETKMTLFFLYQNIIYDYKWHELNFDEFWEILTNPVGTSMRENERTKPFRQTMVCP